MQVAIVLAKHLEKGLDDQEYSRNLEILAQGLGQGTVLQDLANMASGEVPGLGELRDAILHLVARETSELARFAEGRMAAIEALKKIVAEVDFRASNREKDIQELFESAPWLVDSVFTQLVTKNQWLDTTYRQLAKHLRCPRIRQGWRPDASRLGVPSCYRRGQRGYDRGAQGGERAPDP